MYSAECSNQDKKKFILRQIRCIFDYGLNTAFFSFPYKDMRHVMRKLVFSICKTILAADNCPADMCLCFWYIDNTIHLIHKSENSSLWPSVAVQPGLCWTWLKTLKNISGRWSGSSLYLLVAFNSVVNTSLFVY